MFQSKYKIRHALMNEILKFEYKACKTPTENLKVIKQSNTIRWKHSETNYNFKIDPNE